MSMVYLNGQYLALEDARISVLDRGFLFGDGVYEVIPAYGGRAFRLAQHLRRLQNSLDGIRLKNPLSNEEWEAILLRLLAENCDPNDGRNDQSIYLQLTRGVAMKRDHAFPDNTAPTVLVMSSPIPEPSEIISEQGVPAIQLPDSRWQHCHIKATTLLANVLLRQEAVDADAAEAILVRDDLATEGAASNLFVITEGVIRTPPKSANLLPGITRDLVLELAEQHDIAHREENIPTVDLPSADEIWLTSSTREIIPVTLLDGKPVGSGKPGPIWQRMIQLYQAYKNAVRAGTTQ